MYNVRCLFLNLSKVFDTVQFVIEFGIRDKLLDLLTSYLKIHINILMCVTRCLEILNNHAGYPRNLALASSFFIVHYNIPLISNFYITLFADNACLMMADKNLKNLGR